MSYEKRWSAIPATAFTSSGTSSGIVTITSTKGFHVKQSVLLRSDNLTTPLQLQVKSVISSTQLTVGPKTSSLTEVTDISAYSLSQHPTIEAPLQPRPTIDQKEYLRSVFEEEPTVALRTTQVDPLGNQYTLDNPMPVQLSDGSVQIGTVEGNLEVQLTAKDNDPNPGDIHDSIRIGDGSNELKVNPDGSLTVVLENNITVGTTTNLFNQISAVAMGITTTIISYTVPVGNDFKLCLVEVGGSNIAEYEVLINGSLNARKRTWFSGPFTDEFIFETNLAGGIVVPSGQIISVQVTHDRPDLGDFEARILGEIIS